MAGLTDYAAQEVADSVVGGLAHPSWTIVVALFTSAPTDGIAAGSPLTGEVSGGSYARQSASWNAAGSTGVITNNGAITFPKATADWGTVTHFGLVDSGTNELIVYGALDQQRLIESGDTAEFADTELAINFNGN